MTSLKIAGGVYREICQFPERREILGSGGRAAAALADFGLDVELHTFVPEYALREVRTALATYEISLHYTRAKHLVAFRWMHGLASPQQEPALDPSDEELRLEVQGDAVLRYGMVEGTAQVDGDMVVYDPQAPLHAESFWKNGSKAKALAYVVNWAEAKLLTGSTDPYEQLKMLHDVERAAVVVLKLGPHGAIVSDGQKTERVPCFKTANVWPIGSGDVFSAVFCNFWAIEKLSCQAAALRASLATAYYCNASFLPLPRDFLNQGDFKPCVPTTQRGERRRIYLAGPFFTVAQRWLIDSLRDTFAKLDVDVFSPVHDVGEGDAKEIAKADLSGLDGSDVVFAVCDGLDAGTLFEVGYAVSRQKPVVAFSQLVSSGDMLMLKGTGCDVESDLDTAIYKAVWLALER